MSKDEILEAYLNTVYFGDGAYGVGTAARAYFGKDVKELTLAESALLAGIIQSPSNYGPRSNPENAIRRRNLILSTMQENGAINNQEYSLACAEDLKLAQEEESATGYSWYMDQVMQ